MTEKRKYKDPKTAKKDPLHTGMGWESTMGQAIGALFGKKDRLTKNQYGAGVLKIPGLRSKRKKKNGPS